MSTEAEQQKLRSSLLEKVQGENIEDSMIVGFVMMIDVMDREGNRACAKVTSDASGRPLAWYFVNGLADALVSEEEFDAEVDDSDLGE